jgi:hypothetical protein
MKKSLALASLVIALTATLSCEQQSWEQTKMFKQTRHAHGDDHGSAHGADASHGAPAAAHGAADAHGTKPAAH